MKIQSYEMNLAGQREATQQYQKSTALRAWVGNQRPDFEGRNVSSRNVDRVSLSERAQMATPDLSTNGPCSNEISSKDESSQLDSRSRLILMMVEALTGRKIKIISAETLSQNPPQTTNLPNVKNINRVPNDSGDSGSPVESTPEGYGVEYDYHESYSEMEQSDFSAQGVVRTADGKQINFTLSLSMSRSYSTQTDVSVRLGDAARLQKDPLVINFDGTADQLSSTKFNFDLDADGQNEKISFAGQDSGFLALDRNQDGTINNGTELFGAITGDGFAELAAYDQDKNGWIDENDTIFDKIKVWTKDGNGADHLSGLKSHNVGALYLGAISTPFELKTDDNVSLGTIRTSSVYLKEDGSSGALRQVDLTV